MNNHRTELTYFSFFSLPLRKKQQKTPANQKTETVTFGIAVHIVELTVEKEQICKYRSCDICSAPLLPNY